jgi:hypothetical protein
VGSNPTLTSICYQVDNVVFWQQRLTNSVASV